jgi:FecR protein
MNESNRPGPLRALRLGVDPMLDSEREAERRARIVGRIHTLQKTLSQEPVQAAQTGISLSRITTWATRKHTAMLAAAAVFGSVVALVAWPTSDAQLAAFDLRDGELTVTDASGERQLREAQRFELLDGSTLQTSARAARVTLPSQANAALDPVSVVGFERVGSERASAEPWGERLRLRSGKVALKVPHLGPRQYLAVETSDAVVEVHGTEFSVQVEPAVAADALATTRVYVVEGVVSVTHHGERKLLTAGQSWVTPIATAAEVPDAVEAHPSVPELAPSTPGPSAAATTPVKRVEAPQLSPAAQDLAEQNRLFAAAQRARIEGRNGAALEGFDTLSRRFPRSELAQNARVEKFRLLASSGRGPEARRAAASYLGSYPNGFARAEAQALLAQ